MSSQAPNIGGSKTEEAARLDYLKQTLMPDAAVKMAVLSNIAILLLGWLSLSLEVFIRRDFGERYLGYVRLAFTGCLLAIYLEFLTFFSSAVAYSYDGYGYVSQPRDSGPLGIVFLVAFAGMAVYHRIRISQKKRVGMQWHSMSFGVSRLAVFPMFQTANDWTLYRFWEPVIFFLLGTVLSLIFHSTIGTWMQMASLALAVKNQLVFAQQYSRILDMIDAQLEATFFNAAVQGKPKTQTAGFTVVPANYSALVSTAPLNLEGTVNETLRQARNGNASDTPKPAPTMYADTVRDTLESQQKTQHNGGKGRTGN